jgi:dTDP-4-dehydrorhamnose 3,5-epimerase
VLLTGEETAAVLIERCHLADVVCFRPEARHEDDRGWFVRTLDVDVAERAGVDARAFLQDSQSRSRRGVLRGMHGRAGAGEAKLVRCARGAVFDVLVDARPTSSTFGRSAAFRLDDEEGRHLYVPRGFLHGFQALTEWADVCYRIDRGHDPAEDLAVRYDDPDLAIRWPLPVSGVSGRDAAAGGWRELADRLGAGRR